MGSPRVDVVFRLWQCDKENQGWREGPLLTVSWQSFDLLAGPSPSGKVSFGRKKNTALRRCPRAPHLRHWPVISDNRTAKEAMAVLWAAFKDHFQEAHLEPATSPEAQ